MRQAGGLSEPCLSKATEPQKQPSMSTLRMKEVFYLHPSTTIYYQSKALMRVCELTCVCIISVCLCVRWVQVLVPEDHPAGRFVLVADMSNIKLGQAMGEGQVTTTTSGRSLATSQATQFYS